MRTTDKIQACGRCWKLSLTANRVLSALAVLEERQHPPDVLVAQACKLLVRGTVPAHMQEEVLQAAFTCAQEGVSSAPSTGPQTLDINQDWGLIHAAFLQAYNIDLDKILSKIHWRRFLTLLQGLPDCTKLAWVQEIRATPMPKPTRYNAEERARLAKLKSYYAIKVKPADSDNQLQGLFETLSAMAKAGG